MAEEASRRIELVEENEASASEAARTGVGLLLGFVLGRQSLVAAATGSEQFEFAVAHFVGVVLVSVAGALFLGSMYDRMTRAAARADAEDQTTEALDSEADQRNDRDRFTTTELPSGMPR